jgi:hypothetical protein
MVPCAWHRVKRDLRDYLCNHRALVLEARIGNWAISDLGLAPSESRAHAAISPCSVLTVFHRCLYTEYGLSRLAD